MFTPGNPVLLEMISYAPDEQPQQAHAQGRASSASDENMKMLMQAVQGFMHAGITKRNKNERRKTLPRAKPSPQVGVRARPVSPSKIPVDGAEEGLD
mmetsp:Transcript_58624/g.136330  ORF Transcript_58624/g.136330 Transcript_58624/m.136330 type:complete len:97 (-) Transcript_58624:46-336(-)